MFDVPHRGNVSCVSHFPAMRAGAGVLDAEFMASGGPPGSPETGPPGDDQRFTFAGSAGRRRLVGRPGVFDIDQRLKDLSAKDYVLERLKTIVDVEEEPFAVGRADVASDQGARVIHALSEADARRTRSGISAGR
jgi:hypothetical protein